MNLKKLSNEEVKNIYNTHMIKDFPSGELKPYESIANLIKRKIYICYGLYKNSKLLAYAFLVTSKSYLLIDYYAVCAEHRNTGIGSEFLSILKEKCKIYSGIIVEVEKVQCALDEEERIIRKRRVDFYKRNGMRMTEVSSTLFNIEYSIMCLCNEELDDSVIYEELKNIYKEIIPIRFSKFVEVSYTN